MYRFWEIMTLPLLDAHKPKVVVEIGSQHGHNTRYLYDFCAQNDAVLHTIDPVPLFELSDIAKRRYNILHMYKDLSLNVLPSIHNIDVVLIDGDHNWYTVYHELKILADQAKQDRSPLPMVLFHDVSWPYARRDLYYNPATIPGQFRHSYGRKGLMPSEKGTSDSVFNNHLNNALYEGGEKNGVLTAVEDFIAESNEDIILHVIPAYHGYGILVSESRLAMCPELRSTLSELLSSEILLRMIENLEKDRVKVLVGLAQKSDRIAEKDAEIAEMRCYREELYGVYVSRSWRYTAPARKIKSLIGRVLRPLRKPRLRTLIKCAYFMLPAFVRENPLIENLKDRFKEREAKG